MYSILLIQCLLLTYCGVFKLFTDGQNPRKKGQIIADNAK